MRSGLQRAIIFFEWIKLEKCFLWGGLIALTFFFHNSAFAEWEVRGKLMKDSVELGELIPYSLVVVHDKEQFMVFPDKDFGSIDSLEWHHKQSFLSKVGEDGKVYDSIVYFFQPLILRPFFVIKLPVIEVLANGERTYYYAEADTVFLKEIITGKEQQVELKANVDFFPLKKRFDYPLLIVVLGGVFLVLAIVTLSFGKRLLLLFLRLRKNVAHKKFMRQWEKLKEELKTEPKATIMQDAVSSWKRYGEQLTGKPLRAYSSKDLTQLISNSTFSRAIKESDRWVYGGLKPSDPIFVMTVLEEQMQRLFDEQTSWKEAKNVAKIDKAQADSSIEEKEELILEEEQTKL